MTFHTQAQLPGVKILTDEEDENPILGYESYAKSIVKIVKGSDPNFCVGIYGNWGTGKSTLMRLIKKKIEDQANDIPVIWRDLQKKSSSPSMDTLKWFLSKNYNIEWIKNLNFLDSLKATYNTITISDSSDTINTYDKHNNKTHLLSSFPILRKFITPAIYEAPKNVKTHLVSISIKEKESNFDNKSKAVLQINNVTKDEFDLTREKDEGTIIHLKDNEILTVWFNAWRYEREDQYALIALMKTIAYAMSDLSYYQEIKKILLRGIAIITKGVVRNLAIKHVMTEKSLDELEKTLLPKIELLSKVDKDTIYFDGFHMIEQEMEKISTDYGNVKIIVFIDDLDRCSPQTTLEVFESIKVFLGIKNFVYIVGLSDKTITKLISARYKDLYKDLEIKGEDYIRKIIQLPITIPEWNENDIDELISHLSETKKLAKPYNEIIIGKGKDLIPKAIKRNPREVKRFINNFIVAHNIYFSDNNDKEQLKELLVVQALKIVWEDFYPYISSKDSKFRDEIAKYLDFKSHGDRNRKIDDRKNNKESSDDYEREILEFLLKFQTQNDLWDFLKKNQDIIFKIPNWDIYRRAVESTLNNWIAYRRAEGSIILASSDVQNKEQEYIVMGDEYYDQKKYYNAVEWYEKAIDINPNNFKALLKAAISYTKRGRYMKAIKYYDILLDMDPNNALLLNNKADALSKLENISEKKLKEEALPLINKSLEINPNNDSALDTKGFILYKLGKYKEAVEYFDKAIEISEKPRRFDRKAATIEKLGDFDGAKQCRDKANELRRKRMGSRIM